MSYCWILELWRVVIFFFSFCKLPISTIMNRRYPYNAKKKKNNKQTRDAPDTTWGHSSGRPVPCGNSERPRRSAGRSVWSPARWGVAARWWNRTAPLCWHIPWWSQSYLCSQTLWGEQQYTNALLIQQSHLDWDNKDVTERSVGRTATGEDIRWAVQHHEEWGEFSSQEDAIITVATRTS